MALVATITPPTGGEVGKIYGTLAFDNNYQTGGMLLTALQLGAQRIKSLSIQSEKGYLFEVIYATPEPTSVLIKVFQGAGGTFAGVALPSHGHDVTTVVEETVTVVGDQGTLANIPAGVFTVDATAAGATGGKVQVSSGTAPAAGEVQVNLGTGVLTFNAADAVTQTKVNYLRAATSLVSAGTPSGTITGGAASEVAGGTNLTTLSAVEFVATVFGDS